MRHVPRVGVGERRGTFFEKTDRLFRFELLANAEEVAKVSPLNELHDDEVLAGDAVRVDVEDGNDVGVAHGHPHLAFAFEKLDLVRVFGPAAAEDLDRHHRPGVGFLRAEDAAEAARRDAVDQTVAAQEIPEGLVLEKLAALPGSEVAFAFQGAQQRPGVRLVLPCLAPAFPKLARCDQAKMNGFLGQGGIKVQHERVGISAKLCHDEGDFMHHQPRDEMHVAA